MPGPPPDPPECPGSWREARLPRDLERPPPFRCHQERSCSAAGVAERRHWECCHAVSADLEAPSAVIPGRVPPRGSGGLGIAPLKRRRRLKGAGRLPHTAKSPRARPPRSPHRNNCGPDSSGPWQASWQGAGGAFDSWSFGRVSSVLSPEPSCLPDRPNAERTIDPTRSRPRAVLPWAIAAHRLCSRASKPRCVKEKIPPQPPRTNTRGSPGGNARSGSPGPRSAFGDARQTRTWWRGWTTGLAPQRPIGGTRSAGATEWRTPMPIGSSPLHPVPPLVAPPRLRAPAGASAGARSSKIKSPFPGARQRQKACASAPICRTYEPNVPRETSSPESMRSRKPLGPDTSAVSAIASDSDRRGRRGRSRRRSPLSEFGEQPRPPTRSRLSTCPGTTVVGETAHREPKIP